MLISVTEVLEEESDDLEVKLRDLLLLESLLRSLNEVVLEYDECVVELELVVFSRYVELESVELVLEEDFSRYVELESVLEVDHSSRVELLSELRDDSEEPEETVLKLTSEFVLSELVLQRISEDDCEVELRLERVLLLLSVEGVDLEVCARIVELVLWLLLLDGV